MEELLTYLNPPAREGSPILLAQLAINLLAGAILATLLRLHYVRFARSLANRREFAQNFLTITLATILIISVVKNSVPISLGMVGALSIVRFRTPIKDPEELSYLFLTIALGVGLGAGYVLATTAAYFLILLLMTALRRSTAGPAGPVHLEINLPQTPEPDTLGKLTAVLAGTVEWTQLQRFEAKSNELLAAFAVRCAKREDLARATAAVLATWPQATITAVDHEHLPHV